jgi:hypothetical protein
MSPVVDWADVVPVAKVRSPSPFDSLVPGLSIVEILVGEIYTRPGGAAVGRLSQLESGSVDFEWNAADRAGAKGATRQ